MNNFWKRKISFLALFSIGIFTLCGCAVLQQYTQMATFAKCEFRLASVDSTQLAGIPIQGVAQISDLGFMNLAKLQGLFSGGALPLQFTVNIEAKNPNSSSAAMNKMAWILYVDDNEWTSGLLKQRVEIPARGGVGTVPLSISVDLNQLLSGKAFDSIINLALNIAGEGTKPTRVSLKMKPSILIGDQEIQYPGYVIVSHEFSAEESKEVRGDVLNRLNQGLASN
jgi:hypothetical protein